MKRLILFLLLFVISISGCARNDQSTEKQKIDFLAQVISNSNNEVEISLQLITPNRDIEKDPDFNAKMELFNQNKELRAEANMPERPFMKKGELYHIFTWRGQLDPGVYQLKWSSANFGGTTVSFEVVQNPSGLISIGNLSIVNNQVN
ncbi:MAG: hypothetical protein K0B14_10715 [Anaerolineaceae bacterium]|nr:hypothetical protein [Anaerolineaceae bacterium]